MCNISHQEVCTPLREDGIAFWGCEHLPALLERGFMGTPQRWDSAVPQCLFRIASHVSDLMLGFPVLTGLCGQEVL